MFGTLLRTAILRLGTAAALALATVTAQAQVSTQTRPDVGARRVILITGSTDGLGREVARRVGAAGAHVIVHGRNKARGDSVVAEINASGKGTARFYGADLASLAQVRQLAGEILRDYDRIDVLVNNAGIWLSQNTRQTSADGHELHFAVNYLSGYLLTRLLLPRLTGATPGRIVNVASGAQQAIQFDDVMLTSGYNDSRGYAQSKLAQVMFTFDLARELADRKVIVNALHPATMMPTTMVLSRNATPRGTIEAGAEAVINLIDNAAIGTGQYFNGLRAGTANQQAYDENARERLRTLSNSLVGIR
jgi:NAD(P)-dependent dehydrogenase (short-subunit alcohol dehydrogenase family)